MVCVCARIAMAMSTRCVSVCVCFARQALEKCERTHTPHECGDANEREYRRASHRGGHAAQRTRTAREMEREKTKISATSCSSDWLIFENKIGKRIRRGSDTQKHSLIDRYDFFQIGLGWVRSMCASDTRRLLGKTMALPIHSTQRTRYTGWVRAPGRRERTKTRWELNTCVFQLNVGHVAIGRSPLSHDVGFVELLWTQELKSSFVRNKDTSFNRNRHSTAMTSVANVWCFASFFPFSVAPVRLMTNWSFHRLWRFHNSIIHFFTRRMTGPTRRLQHVWSWIPFTHHCYHLSIPDNMNPKYSVQRHTVGRRRLPSHARTYFWNEPILGRWSTMWKNSEVTAVTMTAGDAPNMLRKTKWICNENVRR